MFAPGTRFGPYEIVLHLAEGGMGDVYKALDTRLDRTVALKLLPSHLSGDGEMRKRFEREAKAISALTHPNICALYDVGSDGGQEFLVMEYLDGETLAQRLVRGRLDLTEVVRIAGEIADALEKAHRQGIVHRDLKPGNVVLTRGGAKLLDFGLAKWVPPEQGSMLGRADDLTAPLTMQGMLLGTIPYMAPEQLEGKDVDARTDIFALGAILYEMATGVRAFSAASNASLIAAIMREEPPPASQVRGLSTRGLDQIIRTCLAKNPDERFQSAHDVRIALHMLSETGDVAAAEAKAEAMNEARRKPWLMPIVVSLLVLTAMITAAMAFYLRRAEEPRSYRFNIYPPAGSTFPSLGEGGGVALSPDGGQLVFAATTPEGSGYLWLRALDSEVPEMLEGSQGGEYPFWSPDGRAIAFFADGKLKRMNVPDGPAQTVCDAPSGRGGAWNGAGVILFATSSGPLQRVPASGGQPGPAGTPLADAYSHRWPVFIDDEHFLFVVQSPRPSAEGVFVGSLGARETRRLLPNALSVAFAPPDRLYSVRDDVLVRQRFDPRRLELTGDATTISNQMVYYKDRGYVPITAASSGTVVFRRNGAANMRITWFGRDGLRQGTIGEAGEYEGVSIAPDGARVAFGYFDVKESLNHIAIAAAHGGPPRRFTFASGNQYSPVWSPDGTRIAFSDDQAGVATLSVRPLAGTSKERPLIPLPKTPTYAQSWSPDGEYLLFRVEDPKTNYDVHLLSLASNKTSELIAGAKDQSQAQFSPDGLWVAYTSTESGRLEVYVQPFPATGAKWQVSPTGGEQPRWRRDGKELFYLAPDRTLMAVPIHVPGAFDAEAPQRLFQSPYIPVGDIGVSQSYAVSADGLRFLVAAAEPGSPQSPLTVITK